MKKIDNRTLGKVFTGIAVAGVGVSNIITAYRTPKFKQNLEAANGNKPEAVVKTYWPSFLAVGLTCGSIIMAETVNLKELAAVTGVCTYLIHQRGSMLRAIEKGDKDLAKDLIRTNAEPEMEKTVERYYRSAGPSVEETGRGDLLCFEGWGGRLFRSCETDVDRAIEKMRKRFAECDAHCMNDFYADLGIMQTNFGHVWGWPGDEGFSEAQVVDAAYCPTGTYLMSAVEPFFCTPIEPKRYNDEPILVIDIYEPPMEGWREM